MLQAHIYLNFFKKTEEAFLFYRSVLGGEFSVLTRYSDMNIEGICRPEDMDGIMHICLPINDSVSLMGTDILEGMGLELKLGNNSYICLCPESKEESDRIFNELAEGGKVDMPLQSMPWGAYFGTLTDKFGVKWMVNYAEQSDCK